MLIESNLNIEMFSFQAHNYSTNLLPLSNSSRLCSNIIHFYTHYSSEEDFRQLDIQPEKIAPYFNKPIVVEFPLKNSAISMYNKHENEFKILVSYDEVRIFFFLIFWLAIVYVFNQI